MKPNSNDRGALATLVLALSLLPMAIQCREPAPDPDGHDWPVYGGDQGATRYSPLDQINATNVARLEPAWVHHTEDASQRPSTRIECTPIVVDGVMYLTTARLKLQALDASSGQLIWSFDPFAGKELKSSPGTNRAVTYWQDPAQPKHKRIFLPVKDSLYCIDAGSGERVSSFGEDGLIDLKQNFDHDMTGLSFSHSSPVVVYQDVVIVGGGGGEGPYPEAPGHIRGYDARSGKRRWIFHTVPKPGEFGNDTWEGDSWKTSGGTNNWAGMSLDTERGWVFASIGSPSFDYYGGNRKGANLFGNSVLALDALTGKRIWHFQTVHHDVWDYDLPAQPTLVTAIRDGKHIDAVAQVTKTAMVFLFDRESGEPLFPVEERPIPPSEVPGEELWPTQPFPVKPPPLSRQGFTEDQITDISPEAHASVKKLFDQNRTGALYTPPSLQGTFIHPGFRGGALWGGCSFDPSSGRLFVPTSEWTNHITLAPAREDQPFDYHLPVRRLVHDSEGYPGIKPPWGYLTAIDLGEGEFVWREVVGEFPELTARGIPKTGSLITGGAITTAGGIIFLGGTLDNMFRAFDSNTGKVLWEHQLNAGGFATPCTYQVKGRQYVVIAAGGGQAGSKSGDEFVAFALP